MTTTLLLATISLLLESVYGQSCLASPPAVRHDATRDEDSEWEAIPGVSNAYQRVITFDKCTKYWEDVNAIITTRLFDCYFPSQTLRFKRGTLYQITVENNLGPESPDNPTESNVWKDGNTTNIHTHGLHLSGMYDSDNVFISIPGGSSHTYRYNIPCHHAGGTFWWHPHHHGATHIQVAAGAAGALIIEDDAESEGLPDWYTQMEELVFFITHLHLAKYTSMNPDWEEVWSYDRYDANSRPGSIDTWFINGEYKPTICQTAGEWTKFRFAHVETTEKARIYYIGNGTGECTQYLLARDGVMVHGKDDTDMPRQVGNGVFLTHSSRADVAISCPGHASGSRTHPIWLYDDDGDRVDIAYIEVTGTATEPATELTSFTPIRPDYLENLMPGKYEGDWEYQQYEHCEGTGRDEVCNDLDYLKDMEVSGATIMNSKFDGESNYMATMEVHKLHIWDITAESTSLNVHPLHIHINHFQLINSSLNEMDPSAFDNWVDIPYGYHEEGDWLDTIWGPGFVTFKTDVYAGTVTIHCHILIHEDQGAMGTVLITNGCDGDYQDTAGDGACDYVDTCGQFGTDAPTADTQPPSTIPTTSPTIPVPSTSPTKAPTTANPTKDPTKSPIDQPLSTDLELVLRGQLANFLAEATAYTDDTTMFVLGAQCVEYAMDLESNPELDAVTITVTSVDRGSVHIYYTLTAWDSDLLTTAENNVIASVDNGYSFVADADSSQSFKLMEHNVITAQHFIFDDGSDDETWWKSIFVESLAVMIGVIILCCVCVGCVVFCRQRRRYKYNVEWLDETRADMEMSPRMSPKAKVDVSTPIVEEENMAGAATTSGFPSMSHNVVHSNSVMGSREQSPFTL